MNIFATVNLLELSEKRLKAALEAVRGSGVVEAWESVGAQVNITGSVRSGLIMKNLDIDFHIYTGEPMLEKSLAAIARLKQNPAISDISFRDLLDTEEECLEWHARYEDAENNLWQLDMIHIRRGSAFDGVIERTTEAVTASLTPEIREAILRIKHDAPDGEKAPGIEVCYAVMSLGLRTYDQFAAWKRECPDKDLLGWTPRPIDPR